VNEAEMLTQDQIVQALPVPLRGSVTQSLVDAVNNITTDPEMAETIRENFISYTSVLKDGKFKMEDYLNAVTFVSFKLMNLSNKDAYARTFPGRMAYHAQKGTSQKDLSAYVASYAANKLVNLVLEMALIPVWILNHDAYQKAINTQVRLMTTSSSDLVQTQAANSILTHLGKPKEAATKLQINLGETNGMKELVSMMQQLAQKQLQSIEQGNTSAREVAATRIIDVELEEDGTR
jgi:hypothetical protein